MSGSCGMQAKGNPAIKSERKAPAVARVRAAKAPSETQGPRTRYDEAKRRFRVHRAISTARYHMEVNQWRTPLMPSTKGRENANMSCRGVMSQDCGHPRTRTWRSGYLSCREQSVRTIEKLCNGAMAHPSTSQWLTPTPNSGSPDAGTVALTERHMHFRPPATSETPQASGDTFVVSECVYKPVMPGATARPGLQPLAQAGDAAAGPQPRQGSWWREQPRAFGGPSR